MWLNDDFVTREEVRIDIRLVAKHVQAGTCHFAGLQSVNEGGLLDYCSTRCVNEESTVFHGRELFGADHSRGLLVQWYTDGDNIRREKQVLKRAAICGLALFLIFPQELMSIVVQNLEIKGRCLFRDTLSQVSDAELEMQA